MKDTTSLLAELISYLNNLRTLVPNLPLDKKIFKEGTTAGQVAFHAAQSANYYLRTCILNEPFNRNRSEEFTLNYSAQDIISSIDLALKACQEVADKRIDLNSRLQKPKTVHSRGFVVNTVLEAIRHTTAHTAEHFGQLTTLLTN